MAGRASARWVTVAVVVSLLAAASECARIRKGATQAAACRRPMMPPHLNSELLYHDEETLPPEPKRTDDQLPIEQMQRDRYREELIARNEARIVEILRKLKENTRAMAWSISVDEQGTTLDTWDEADWEVNLNKYQDEPGDDEMFIPILNARKRLSLLGGEIDNHDKPWSIDRLALEFRDVIQQHDKLFHFEPSILQGLWNEAHALITRAGTRAIERQSTNYGTRTNSYCCH